MEENKAPQDVEEIILMLKNQDFCNAIFLVNDDEFNMISHVSQKDLNNLKQVVQQINAIPPEILSYKEYQKLIGQISNPAIKAVLDVRRDFFDSYFAPPLYLAIRDLNWEIRNLEKELQEDNPLIAEFRHDLRRAYTPALAATVYAEYAEEIKTFPIEIQTAIQESDLLLLLKGDEFKTKYHERLAKLEKMKAHVEEKHGFYTSPAAERIEKRSAQIEYLSLFKEIKNHECRQALNYGFFKMAEWTKFEDGWAYGFKNKQGKVEKVDMDELAVLVVALDEKFPVSAEKNPSFRSSRYAAFMHRYRSFLNTYEDGKYAFLFAKPTSASRHKKLKMDDHIEIMHQYLNKIVDPAFRAALKAMLSEESTHQSAHVFPLPMRADVENAMTKLVKAINKQTESADRKKLHSSEAREEMGMSIGLGKAKFLKALEECTSVAPVSALLSHFFSNTKVLYKTINEFRAEKIPEKHTEIVDKTSPRRESGGQG